MPRRSILSAAERERLLAVPDTHEDLIRHYTFSEADIAIIRQRRGPANRLGFAVQLCYLRFPGIILGVTQAPFPPLLKLVADQLKVADAYWDDYGQREQTRREHLLELQAWLGITLFSAADYLRCVRQMAVLAQQTDRGIVLAEALVELLRQERIILPALDVIERVCSEALTRGTRQVYEALTAPLLDHHHRALDGLLGIREGTKGSGLIWLRQPPGPPKPKHLLVHLERLNALRDLWLPDGLEQRHPPEPPPQARPRGRADDRPARARPGADPPLRDAGGRGARSQRDGDRRDHRSHTTASSARCSAKRSAITNSNSRQSGKAINEQGAPVLADRPCPARRQADGRRSVRGDRGRHPVGRVQREHRPRPRSSPSRKTSTTSRWIGDGYSQLAALRADLPRGADHEGRPGRAGHAGGRGRCSRA